MRLTSVVGFIFYCIPMTLPWVAQGDDDAVRYQNDRLSVDFTDLTLAAAVEQLNRETGIMFSVPAPLKPRRLNEQFDELPLVAAMQRLFKGYNHIILFDDTENEKRLERVILLDHSRDLALPSEPPAVIQPDDPEVTLYRHRSGHYVTTGMINDHPVEFLVDTGATLVTIPGELADHAGLDYGAAKTVNTANGQGRGYMTTLERVDVQGLVMQRVPALILPDMQHTQHALLGMSFLEAFELQQRNNTLIIRHTR